MTAGSREPVEGVGAEAVKLLQALQDWAQDSGSDYADAAAAAGAGAASTARSVGEHLATGGEDCTYCPVCRAISVVRETSPEVRQHLRSAASSLVEAASAMLATPVPRPGAGSGGTPVEKIDLDGEWEDD